MIADALCLVGFGGPEHLDEVPAFLRRVSQGRIPEERLAEVGQHYVTLGGKSPLNDQHRQMLANLAEDLSARGIALPMALGNRNSAPWLPDALRTLKADGAARVLALLTSPFPSYSGCRQYREDLAQATRDLGDDAPEVVVVRPDPSLLRAPAARLLREALAEHPDAPVMFTAHSIPLAMDAASGPGGTGAYAASVRQLAADVAADAGIANYDVVWQSRSGSPRTPWLDPQIDDAIAAAADQGVRELIVHPIGFLTDHVEVIWDLDHQAADVARERGVIMHRLPTVGFTPEYRAGLADLVAATLNQGVTPTAFCGKDCCHAARPA